MTKEKDNVIWNGDFTKEELEKDGWNLNPMFTAEELDFVVEDFDIESLEKNGWNFNPTKEDFEQFIPTEEDYKRLMEKTEQAISRICRKRAEEPEFDAEDFDTERLEKERS